MRDFTVVCVWRCLPIVGSSKRTGAGSRWDPGSVALAVGIGQGCSVARESRLWYCCLLRLVLEGIKTLESVLPLPEMFLSSLCCCGPLSWPCHLQEGEEPPLHSLAASCVFFCCPAMQPYASKLSTTCGVLKRSCLFSTWAALIGGACWLLCMGTACSASQYPPPLSPKPTAGTHWANKACLHERPSVFPW